MSRKYTKHSEHKSLANIMKELQSDGVVKGFSTRKRMVAEDYANDRKALQQYVSNAYQKLYKQAKEIIGVFRDKEIRTAGLNKRLEHLTNEMTDFQGQVVKLKNPTKTGKTEKIEWSKMSYEDLVNAAVHYQNQLAKGPMVEYKRLRAQAKDIAKEFDFNTDEATISAVLLAWDTLVQIEEQEVISQFSDGEGNYEYSELGQDMLLNVICKNEGISYNQAVEKYIKKRKK